MAPVVPTTLAHYFHLSHMYLKHHIYHKYKLSHLSPACGSGICLNIHVKETFQLPNPKQSLHCPGHQRKNQIHLAQSNNKPNQFFFFLSFCKHKAKTLEKTIKIFKSIREKPSN
ncbi:hypothetical protein DsansV1_C02g0014151 [Dioscorea sansibarensis]